MERQKVYCEIDFYKQFLNSYPKEPTPGEESIKKMKYWIAFNSFLFKSDIFFNISIAQFEALTADEIYFKTLWKKSANGECGIEFIASEFPIIKELDECINNKKDFSEAVYLTCEAVELCKEIENSYGIKVICISNLYENEKLFDFHIEPILSGINGHTTWSFLEIYKHNCNSLAIVDNYILTDTSVIMENLLPILDALLPKRIKTSFHISVFAKKEFPGRPGKDFKLYHDLIRSEIETMRPDLDFKLGIFQLRREIHDRNLITNYIYIDSGSGFNLFRNNISIHQTKIIGFYPSFISNVNLGGSNLNYALRKSLKKIYSDACKTEFLTTYWGDKVNRLFD
jgi:hypothetical protein